MLITRNSRVVVGRLHSFLKTTSAKTTGAQSQRNIQLNTQPTLKVDMSKYETVEKGAKNSPSYSLYFKNKCGNVISPMHDIPLYANEEKTIYNMVVEVPRWTNAKMEISLKTPMNPIKQDIKKGKLRFVANCFPHKGYIWNYGALPQTWENPDHIEPSTGCKGDNDPIDVIEIGYRVAKRGDVMQVKVLGTIALIDEGETDWKIIAIDVNDPLASKVNDISDVDQYFPGLLRATVEWFKIYKIPDGKPENQFAFNGDAKNAEFATSIIAETHKFWQTLINQSSVGDHSISCTNITNRNSEFVVPKEDADKLFAEAPEGGQVEEEVDTVDTWHFIHLK
ncbi:inorganic pyrophosphatase [Drosophila guanche]|uniref:Inorganic pyrophosphatase n=2 Tax=Drosophila guanche TaxID=7266 RepID=A0A3B0J073_DROGU|nr:inorganic pyrophosphatase [Drosophila guanche]SPP74065.1 blast:Inorganic pyrophosphatase [Drosophila guanche]